MEELVPEPDKSLYINPLDDTDRSFMYRLPARSPLVELQEFWRSERDKAGDIGNGVMRAISENLYAHTQQAVRYADTIQHIAARGSLHSFFLEKYQRSIAATVAMSSLTRFMLDSNRGANMRFDNKVDFVWYMPNQNPPVHRVICSNNRLKGGLLPDVDGAHWLDAGNSYAKISRQDDLPPDFTENMSRRLGCVELNPDDYTSLIPYLKQAAWMEEFTPLRDQ